MGKSPGSCTTNCLTVFMPVMTSTKFGQLRSVRQSTKTDWNHWLTPLSKTILLNTWHSCWRVAVCDDHGFAPWWGHCSLLLSLSFITSLTLPCILMMGVHLGGATKSYFHYHYNYCQYMCICAIKGTYQQIHLCHKLIASKAFSYPLGSSVTVSSCWL